MTLTIRGKLILSATMAAIALSGLTWLASFSMGRLGELQDSGYRTTTDSGTANDSANIGAVMYQVVADAEINHDLANSKQAWEKIKAQGMEEVTSLEKLADTPDEKQWSGQAKAAVSAFINIYEMKMLPLLENTPKGQLSEAIRETDNLLDEQTAIIRTNLERMADSMKAEAVKSDQEFDATRSSSINWFIAIAATIILALGVMSTWILLSITRPLQKALELAEAVAKGDLTQRIEVKSQDEVGQLLQALKNMNESLVGIVNDVRNTTDSITTSSQEIAQGNADLSQRTEEQASSLEETASSMEELTSTVRQNTENAKQANQLANNASDIAVKGGKVVGDVVDTMASISTSSRKIVDIISVIEGIAFQTNILALNAAVEAARAGEQGRGFAVVAGEVRNLAQRSAAAAKEIKTLIDDSVSKVDAGSRQVDQAGATMTEIVQAVKRVTDIMSEIAAASNEQSAGIEQVNQAIIQMDEVTQQNAALVEEAAAAAEAMQEQADLLMQAVSTFKLEAGRTLTRAKAEKPTAQHTLAKQAAAHHPVQHKVAPPKNVQKIGKAKDEKDSDWKEF